MLRGFIYGLTLLFSTSVFAQSSNMCFPSDEFTKKVTEEYGEQNVWMGLPSSNNPQERVLVLYENETTRSWTMGIFMIRDDIICFVAAGGDFIHMEPKPAIKKGTKM
jgi:hypothetical protein